MERTDASWSVHLHMYYIRFFLFLLRTKNVSREINRLYSIFQEMARMYNKETKNGKVHTQKRSTIETKFIHDLEGCDNDLWTNISTCLREITDRQTAPTF